ncbi:sigma-54-dependent Fis family transcriptional regulator, partial [Mesorhizobium sp. M00.F.Ca.ET.186.01.1.1]
IAATHKDLDAMIVSGQFREDLYYRLHVIPLHVPPLRERKDDLYNLIHYYLKLFADKLGKESKRFSAQALKCLIDYHWPGNIRELENTLEYIVNLEIGDLVTISSLPAIIRGNRASEEALAVLPQAPSVAVSAPASVPPDAVPIRLGDSSEQPEVQLLLQAIQRFGKSTEGKRKAAEFLGISVATLYRRLQKINRK